MSNNKSIARKDEQELGISSPKLICLNIKKQALVLELSYSSVAKFPDVAQKIREAAVDAKSHQERARGVVKGIGFAPTHICTQMIPIVLQGILEEDEELISEAIAMTIDFIKEEEQKTRELSECFEKLVKTLSNVVEVMKAHKRFYAEKEGRLQIEKEEQHKQAEVLQRALKRVDEERERMNELIKSQQRARDLLLQNIEMIREDKKNSNSCLGFIGTLLGGAALLASPLVPFAPMAYSGAAVILGTNAISSHATRKANNDAINQMAEQLTQAEISARKNLQELRVINDRQEEKEIALYTRVRKAKECEMQIELLCDADSLAMAITCTGRLNGQLDFLTRFFIDLKNAMEQFEREIRTGKLMRKLKTAQQVAQLRGICDKAAKNWEDMSIVCGQIEKAINADIKVNYSFLSKDYDSLTDDERHKRTYELQASISNMENENGM